MQSNIINKVSIKFYLTINLLIFNILTLYIFNTIAVFFYKSRNKSIFKFVLF